MKNKIQYLSALAVLVTVTLASCNSLDQAPVNRFTDANYWTSTDKASAIVNMAYSQMYNASYYFNTETLSDNLYQSGGGDEKRISAGQADAATGRFASEWSDCYSGIKTCHTFLENVDRVPDMDATLKERMKAEIRFIRAFLFFRLATWYGDVPFFDHNLSLDETLTLTRTPHDEVIAFVRNELNEIAAVLPTKQQYPAADNGRITKGAVMMLLARTYLYANTYEQVATICKDIMDGKYGTYELYPSYENLFCPGGEDAPYEYNSEMILDMTYIPSLRTWDIYRDAIPITAGGRVNAFAPTQELVDDYIMLNGKGIYDSGSGYDHAKPELNRDPRFAKTIVYDGYYWVSNSPLRLDKYIYINPNTIPAGEDNRDLFSPNSTSTGYYLRKHYDKDGTASMASGYNLILMRYADVLLMYAEAQNELGQMSQAVWDSTIRLIRQRAGFSNPDALNYPSLDKTAMQTVLRRERRCELAIEGLRIFDIRRWKIAHQVLNVRPHGDPRFIDPNYLDTRTFNPERDYLWPVPQSQKDINPALGQNPNY